MVRAGAAAATRFPSAGGRVSGRHCRGQPQRRLPPPLTPRPCPSPVRSEIMLNSVNAAVLGALFTWGAGPRPSNIGVQDYGGGLKTLALCPPSPNCISTAEEANDPEHYVPQWWVDCRSYPCCVWEERGAAASGRGGAG